jgi:hypothetical protein
MQMKLGVRITAGWLTGLRPLRAAFFLAAFAPAALVLAQETRRSDQPNAKGGYVLVDLGEFRLRLERAWTSTKGMPPFYSWKLDQPTLDQWQVKDGVSVFYSPSDLRSASDNPECRKEIVSLKVQRGRYPGEFFIGQADHLQDIEGKLLELSGPLKNGTPVPSQSRYFYLNDPRLRMSNGQLPLSICGSGELSSCVVVIEIRYPLFATFRYSHRVCGLDGLTDAAVEVKARIVSRFK